MKRLLILYSFLLLCFNSFAQLNINGDFSINSGNNIPGSPGTVCETFTNGSIPHWWRIYGTPDFTGDCNPNYLHMWTEMGQGEGIATDYTFLAGYTYTVKIGVVQWHHDVPTDPGDQLEVSVTTTLPYASWAGGCGNNIASVFSGITKQVVHDWTTTDIGNPNCSSITELSIDFVPSFNCNYLCIYPTSSGEQAAEDVTLTHVYINRTCNDKNEKLYLANNIVESFTGYTNIWAGNTCIPGYPAFMSVTPTGVTVLGASNQITLVPEFYANRTSGSSGYFLATVDPSYACGQFPVAGKLINSGSHINRNITNDRNKSLSNANLSGNTSLSTNSISNVTEYSLSPNPTNGLVNIQVPNGVSTSVTATVVDILGRKLYSNDYNTKNFQIDLSNYPHGIYEITLSTDGNGGISKTYKVVYN